MTTDPREVNVPGYVCAFDDHQSDAKSVHCWDRKQQDVEHS
jgi:hypothetical protein